MKIHPQKALDLAAKYKTNLKTLSIPKMETFNQEVIALSKEVFTKVSEYELITKTVVPAEREPLVISVAQTKGSIGPNKPAFIIDKDPTQESLEEFKNNHEKILSHIEAICRVKSEIYVDTNKTVIKELQEIKRLLKEKM